MKREEKSENSKERIIKAALEEFGQNGYVAASTNNMCKNHDILFTPIFQVWKCIFASSNTKVFMKNA